MKKMAAVAAQHQCDSTMLNCLKMLIQNEHTSPMLLARAPPAVALRLLQATLSPDTSHFQKSRLHATNVTARPGAGNAKLLSPSCSLGDANGVDVNLTRGNTPHVLQCVMPIIEGYIQNCDEGKHVMESEVSMGWLEEEVQQC